MSISEKLETVTENVPKVHNAGKKAEYDAFWDEFQQNGELTSYNYAFCGYGWNLQTFKPKYDIIPVNAAYMFGYGYITGNLKNILSELGITLDFRNATNLTAVFYWNNSTTEIGIMDTRSADKLDATFNGASMMRTIETIILRDDGSQTFSNTFSNCYRLTDVMFDGLIGNSISFPHSPLSAESLVSIYEHLSDTVTGKTVTFKQTAIGNADWTRTAYSSWDDLIATKPNWSIALV